MGENLAQMRAGKAGIVMSVEGGMGAAQRLESLGIRPGARISKISAHFFKGPVVVSVNNRRLALGYGLAQKVFVRTEGDR